MLYKLLPERRPRKNLEEIQHWSDSVRLKQILLVSGKRPKSATQKCSDSYRIPTFSQIHPERVFTGPEPQWKPAPECTEPFCTFLSCQQRSDLHTKLPLFQNRSAAIRYAIWLESFISGTLWIILCKSIAFPTPYILHSRFLVPFCNLAPQPIQPCHRSKHRQLHTCLWST